MVHFFKYTAMALIGLLLAACSSSPTPPPEPNMKSWLMLIRRIPPSCIVQMPLTTESNNAEENKHQSDIAGRSE